MVNTKELELSDYLNKYSCQLVFDVLEIEEETEFEDNDPVLLTCSTEYIEQLEVHTPVKSIFKTKTSKKPSKSLNFVRQ